MIHVGLLYRPTKCWPINFYMSAPNFAIAFETSHLLLHHINPLCVCHQSSQLYSKKIHQKYCKEPNFAIDRVNSHINNCCITYKYMYFIIAHSFNQSQYYKSIVMLMCAMSSKSCKSIWKTLYILFQSNCDRYWVPNSLVVKN